MTKTGTLFTIFLNGVPIGSEISNSPIANASAPLTIAQAESLGFMNGRLDEIAIYSRALTQSELQAIANAGTAGKCKVLSISTKSLSAVQLGTFSSQTLEALFGSAPLNWTLVSGTPPSGMNLSTGGILSGTPTVAGSFPLRIKVTDSQTQFSEKDFTLDVLLTPPPADIRLNKTGTLAVPGRTIDYFILAENVGRVPALNFRAVEFLDPPNFFILTATQPPALVIEQSTILWTLPLIAPGDAKILSYSVRLDPLVAIGSNVPGQVCNLYEWLKELGEPCSFCISICEHTDPAALNCANCIAENKCKLPPQCRPQNDAPRAGVDPKETEVTAKKLIPREQSVAYPLSSDQCPSSSLPSNICATHNQSARGAVDPNEKGAVAKRFIRPDQLLVYPIHFENIGTIEARDVFVTDVLDVNLDATTLNVLTSGGASFEQTTRTLRWDLLNRNLQPGETGNVLLSIRPRPGFLSGTVIRNRARIQFEVFQPLDTNLVENVIDAVKPACMMLPLPAETSGPAFTISWSGSDAVGEIDHYSIFASTDGGPFQPFVGETRATSATFSGQAGKTYGFLCIATDTAGNIEVQSATAEATTRLINEADLAVTKSASPSGTVSAGTNVSYTITVANNGPNSANGVTLTDVVPSGTGFVSLTAPGSWSCTTLAPGTSGTITCTKASMANGETATFTVVAMINCSAPNNTSISDTARINSVSPPDTNIANNSQTVVRTVSNPAPIVSATVGTGVLSPNLNHDLVNVGLAATASDGACPVPTTFTVQVFGDEDDQTPTDPTEAAHSPDAKDIGIGTLRLRAERIDASDGRVYLIIIKTTDGAGGVGFGTRTVVVPKNQSPASLSSVNAQATAAAAFANANNGNPPAGFFVIGDGPVIGPKQ
ncbi:MAG: LamG-like jellyroll fold domain-containing protein [Planctomycetota bacterium]